mgnify:CR=1 FL=1
MKINYNNADPKVLGEMLKKLRKEHKFSQTVIAEYLEVERSTYTKYELGRVPDATVVAKLAALYGISADSILSVFYDGEAEPPSGIAVLSNNDAQDSLYILNKEEQMLIEYYRNCLRKDTVLDFTQNVYLEDAENSED